MLQPSNKGMKLTRPGQNGASQLIPSVRHTKVGIHDEQCRT